VTVSPDAAKGLACQHAGAAANIENAVALPDASSVGNWASPSAEDRRDETRLVDLGRLA
jgi:hypothetical protein